MSTSKACTERFYVRYSSGKQNVALLFAYNCLYISNMQELFSEVLQIFHKTYILSLSYAKQCSHHCKKRKSELDRDFMRLKAPLTGVKC